VAYPYRNFPGAKVLDQAVLQSPSDDLGLHEREEHWGLPFDPESCPPEVTLVAKGKADHRSGAKRYPVRVSSSFVF